MIPSRDQLPPKTALLSDAALERLYSRPPMSDEEAVVIRRLLRGSTKASTKQVTGHVA